MILYKARMSLFPVLRKKMTAYGDCVGLNIFYSEEKNKICLNQRNHNMLSYFCVVLRIVLCICTS